MHAPKVMPVLGSALMRRALADHAIRHAASPCAPGDQEPQISFIIGHRGEARLPHLLATLASIAAQRDAPVECIVVEQDEEPRLIGRLPAWVRHVHTPSPTPDMPYCRSWAFNIGARHARGELLVLHDNDMLVPVDYAARLLAQTQQGYEVVNLKRFIFYLSAAHSDAFFCGTKGLLAHPPETVTQNLEAGGSVAITQRAFEAIGGMDESFIGWGGEDNEFWERAQTQRVWPFGCLPLVHLWHPAQSGKYEKDKATLQRYRALLAIPVQSRIATLRAVPSGAMSGPSGWASTTDMPIDGGMKTSGRAG
ncbi:MAG: glycosyltransferase family 2 protein [Lysobacterales bacterium]